MHEYYLRFQFLYYESMIRILHPKPLYFCVNKPSQYPRNIVRILLKLIFFMGGIFLNNHDDVIFTWIISTMDMTISHGFDLDIYTTVSDKHLFVLAMPRSHIW